MTIKFYISPEDVNGEPLISKIVTVWYVMESGYVHCSCSSPELAKLMLKEILKTHSIDSSYRKQNRDETHEKTLDSGTISTESQLANVAAFALTSRELHEKNKIKLSKLNSKSDPNKNNKNI